MEPVTWLLERFGEDNALTQAGYLNRAFVMQVHERHPWDDRLRTRGTPRSETEVITLHRLHSWLEAAGALRKRGKALRRTERGAASHVEDRIDDHARIVAVRAASLAGMTQVRLDETQRVGGASQTLSTRNPWEAWLVDG